MARLKDTSVQGGLSVAGAQRVSGNSTVQGSFVAPAIYGAEKGAPSTTIWGVSRDDYPDYGIFYKQGSPDYIQFKWGGSVKASINMQTGEFNGIGTGLTALNASNISSGTIDVDYLPTITTTQVDFTNQGLSTSDSPTFVHVYLDGSVKSSQSRLSFLNGGTALPINTNELLVSNSYSDSTLVPINGVYIKGDIDTDGTFNGDGSGITNIQWNNITSKPATATRWPNWSEVSNKPTLNIGNWDAAYSWGDHALAGYESAANKGVAGGYASLDGNGKVPNSQLPSFVDDILEYSSLSGFPATGEAGKIYVAIDTNKTYRWGGSSYVYITSGAVDSVNGKTGVVTLNTSDISESSNLYFTNARAVSAIKVDASWNDNNWNEAYSWGDHATAGYALDSSISSVGKSGQWSDITNKPVTATRWPNWSEVTSKPVLNIVNWDTAYSWGDHALAGYALASSLAGVATSGQWSDILSKPATATRWPTPAEAGAVSLNGDTLSGVLDTIPNAYVIGGNGVGAINFNNSDISGLNGIYFNDTAQSTSEGVMFRRDTGDGTSIDSYSSIRAYQDNLLFAPDASGASYSVFHEGHFPNWNEISSKPTAYPPSSHTHSASDITSGVFSDSRIPTAMNDKTLTGDTTMYHVYFMSDNGAYQRADSRTEGTNNSRTHWYGVLAGGGNTNFRHAWYDGSSYVNVTAENNGVTFGGSLAATGFSGDGSGLSNVDAETLDGVNSTSFTRSDQNDTITGVHEHQEDVVMEQQTATRYGGTDKSSAKYAVQYNPNTNSLDFNYLG